MTCLPTSYTRFFAILLPIVLTACGGGGSDAPPPPPADTTPPTVSAVTVPAGSSVNRIVPLSATANDAGGVSEVRFLVDGTQVGSDATSPYTFDWDTSTVADGQYTLRAEAVDQSGNTAQSSDTTVTVANTVQFQLALSGEQEVPEVISAGTAQADFTVNLVTGEVTGSVVVNGITPIAAHIHGAFAGANGGVLIGLEQDAVNAEQWNAPAAAMLDAAGVDSLLAGALYVNVHTAANPSGELRGQILTEDQVLVFATLDGAEEVPGVSTAASGRAAVTLNVVTGDIVVQANVVGLDDAVGAHVHEAYAGDTGPVLVGLNQDGANLGRWFVEDGLLNAAGLGAYAAGRLYVNVHSPANPSGEVRGQILPDGVEVVFAELSGAQSVPAIDTRASGLAAVTIDSTSGAVTIHANTMGLDDAVAAHLHTGFGGENGGVLVGLTVDGGDPSHWFVEEAPMDAALADAIGAGATYVNVHSPANPGGEIRGQVIPDGILFAYGPLEGAQENPPVPSAASGSFAVTVDTGALSLTAHANTSGADDATGAHVHDGYAGTNGGVAVGLSQDPTNVAHWLVEAAAIDAGQLAAFEAGRLYVNVHTPANPSGEIRGQVAPPPIEVLFTSLSGAEEVPPVSSGASATAASTVNRDTGAITLHLRTQGADDAVASHIHGAFAGQNGGVVLGLSQDAGDVTHWSVVEGQFDEAGLSDYLNGRLYVNLHTPANPSGEVRGQIAPQDIQIVFTDLTGDAVVPPVVTGASGKASTTTNLATRNFVAFVNNSSADDATAAWIHVGGAGENGAEILALQQTADAPSQWSTEAALSSDNFADYRAGGLYALVTTPANASGTLRGQIDPPDSASFDNIAPSVTMLSPGDPVADTVTLEATASDNQGVVEVRFLVDGNVVGTDTTAPYSVSWDSTSVANGDVALTAEADDATGNTGVSAAVTVTVENTQPVSLADIQAQVFGPRCSDCHSGPSGGGLPSGLDLSSAANSHANLVNVMSVQTAFDRVEPGNPDDSYLIRKLEGGPAIVGSQMPQGGPFLDQATINTIRQWITEGAQNN
jgi:hypothetical protein